MPIYEYKCGKCGSTFEHLARSFSEAAPQCPKCGAGKCEKQFSAFATNDPAKAASPGCLSCGDAGTGCGCGCGGRHHHH